MVPLPLPVQRAQLSKEDEVLSKPTKGIECNIPCTYSCQFSEFRKLCGSFTFYEDEVFPFKSIIFFPISS